ncbi:hypothetical protein [Holdemanella biformis]|uniref:hypothetical protein n=1 Tax=Holdemanella biformis TaxID=1735 RepID=UPI0026DFEFEF|nr:hypothetical protein [Holdemanella biformis]
MSKLNSVTCSFTMDRDIYNAYKSVVSAYGENVKGNLVRYMKNVIKYEIPNAETIEAIEDVRKLKENPNKKTYSNFSDLMKEIDNE